jgi:hypothetical protein
VQSQLEERIALETYRETGTSSKPSSVGRKVIQNEPLTSKAKTTLIAAMPDSLYPSSHPIIKTQGYDKVAKCIQQKTSCLLVGLPYIGKSTLLEEIQEDNNDCVVEVIDTENLNDLEEFWESVSERLFWPNTGQPLPEEIVEQLQKSGDRVHILLVDEIDEFLTADLANIRDFLTGLKMLLNSGVILIGTSYRTRRLWKEIWRKTPDIFNLLEEIFSQEIVLNPWSLEDVRRFLHQTPDLTRSIVEKDDLPQLILEESGGVPRLVDELTKRFEEQINEKRLLKNSDSVGFCGLTTTMLPDAKTNDLW